jgi:hypothetical protein
VKLSANGDEEVTEVSIVTVTGECYLADEKDVVLVQLDVVELHSRGHSICTWVSSAR